MTESEIYYYVDNFQALDKAGAYGIQEWIGLAACSAIGVLISMLSDCLFKGCYRELC
jgi:septum formation protein